MAITAKNPHVVEEYTPLSQVDDPNPTIFLIRGLEESEKAIVSGQLHDNARTELTPEDILIDVTGVSHAKDMIEFGMEALKHGGLQGWKNMIDGEGRQVPFKIKNRAANLVRIPTKELQELAMEVMNRTHFDKPEAKNSNGQSTSLPTVKSSDVETDANTGTTADQKTQPQSPSGKSTTKS